MDRRTRNLFALVFVAVVVLAGGAALLLGESSLRDPGAPAGATAAVGVIVGVQSQGLDRVTGFTLRTTDQGTIVFKIGALENGAEFPPGHLVEHQATAQPVRVWYRTDGTTKVAIRLEDAT
ncbi:MAG: hypothetical protein QOC97_1131 [Chloroflexota bacterium]|nr:hypothetical protein [Chloroflexota bacterium]